MTEDNLGCPVCGKHFADEEEFKDHGKYDHPEVQENFPDIFDKKEEQPAKEIDQQEDKPTQTHDDWQKDLDSMRDEYSKETADNCAICNGEHPTAEHPVLASEDEDEQRDITNDINKPYDLVPKIPEPWEYGGADYKREGDPDGDKAQEEGGADDPLAKVADLAESYRYMSKDHRASLFESLDFTQGDSAILSGLEWNELTRPIKVEASEAYVKEQAEETVEAPIEEDEVDKAYENLYNLEKYHSSPDYKKKAITCTRCNESFYNINDRSIHFNEVHATGQEYELPEQCPFCKQIIQEPDNLDWHMQEQHGAHVPSQFTQTGVSAGMADTDFDSLESHKKKANEVEWDDMSIIKKQEILYALDKEDVDVYTRWENLPSDLQTQVVRGGALESHKKANEDYIPAPYDKHFDWVASMDQDDYVCKHCGEMMMANGDALHTQPQNVIVDVVKQHLANHGITESKANEGELASYPDEDEYTDSEFGSTRPKAKEDEPWDLDPTFDEPDGMTGNYAPPSDELGDDSPELEEGGPGSGRTGSTPALLPEQTAMKNINPDYDPFKSTPKSQLMQTDPYITRTTEGESKPELEREIKDLENFINMASYENPLNMGGFQDKLDSLKSQLSTANEEEEEEEDDNEDYPEGWDKRKPTIGGYDPELDYDG